MTGDDRCEIAAGLGGPPCAAPAVATLTVRGHTPQRACEAHALAAPLNALGDFVVYDDGRCGIRFVGRDDEMTSCRHPVGHDGAHGA